MSDSINTTPLGVTCLPVDNEQNAPSMVKASHVSMVFNMASEQLNSLKEYAIALLKHELMFKEFRALDNISFDVKKGDVFGILGTNGSGKSTMLKIVAGVLEPTEGTCSINGNIAPLIELGAGFDMELTARENIYLNGALLGYSHNFIERHFDEIVSFAEIEKFLDMPMKNYSSGMVARIAFAIATVIVPEILIVDEVLSVGDFMFQQKCERRITQLIKEYGVTVLIVSHNNDQIERLCNKVIWIEKGHLRMVGSAEEVCRAYKVLGGHTGSVESEEQVYSMLNDSVKIPCSVLETISSENRYGTAVKLAEELMYSTKDMILIATGELAYPSLIASGLSSILDASILLTKSESLPDVTAQAIRRFQPRSILILGGEDLISQEVESQIKDNINNHASISRLKGNTPATLSVSAYNFALSHNESWNKTAVISYGECTGDILSISPFLCGQKVPLFFVHREGYLDDATSKILESGIFERLIVLGGDQQIPNDFLLRCEAAGTTTERICGVDPYHANELVNDWIDHSDDTEVERLIVSSIWNPYDALTSALYSKASKARLLLENPQNLESVSHAINYIKKQNGRIKHLTFLGDETQFNNLDKELLAKAVAKSLQNS